MHSSRVSSICLSVSGITLQYVDYFSKILEQKAFEYRLPAGSGSKILVCDRKNCAICCTTRCACCGVVAQLVLQQVHT